METLEKHDPRELLRKAKDGDEAAFGKLYDLYFLPVYRYIFFRVKHKAEAEDLAQTVFLKAYAAMPRFEDRGRPPLAFFFTIARNAVVNYWRKKKDLVLSDGEEDAVMLAAQTEDVAHRVMIQEAAQAARGAIQKLTYDQQEVIILKFMNELTNEEISTVLGKSEEAIRQLQSRGLRALRGHLGNYEEA